MLNIVDCMIEQFLAGHTTKKIKEWLKSHHSNMKRQGANGYKTNVCIRFCVYASCKTP